MFPNGHTVEMGPFFDLLLSCFYGNPSSRFSLKKGAKRFKTLLKIKTIHVIINDSFQKILLLHSVFEIL